MNYDTKNLFLDGSASNDTPKTSMFVSKKSPAFKTYQEIISLAEQDQKLVDLVTNFDHSSNKQQMLNTINKKLHLILNKKLNETPIPLSALFKAGSVIEDHPTALRLKIGRHLDTLIEHLMDIENEREKIDSSLNFT